MRCPSSKTSLYREGVERSGSGGGQCEASLPSAPPIAPGCATSRVGTKLARLGAGETKPYTHRGASALGRSVERSVGQAGRARPQPGCPEAQCAVLSTTPAARRILLPGAPLRSVPRVSTSGASNPHQHPDPSSSGLGTPDLQRFLQLRTTTFPLDQRRGGRERYELLVSNRRPLSPPGWERVGFQAAGARSPPGIFSSVARGLPAGSTPKSRETDFPAPKSRFPPPGRPRAQGDPRFFPGQLCQLFSRGLSLAKTWRPPPVTTSPAPSRTRTGSIWPAPTPCGHRATYPGAAFNASPCRLRPRQQAA